MGIKLIPAVTQYLCFQFKIIRNSKRTFLCILKRQAEAGAGLYLIFFFSKNFLYSNKLSYIIICRVWYLLNKYEKCFTILFTKVEYNTFLSKSNIEYIKKSYYKQELILISNHSKYFSTAIKAPRQMLGPSKLNFRLAA